MRESIGQAFLVNLVAIIVGVTIFILVGAVVYSKTFKIKTKLVDIMEKYKDNPNVYEAARDEMEDYLLSIGYRRNANSTQDCPSKKNGTVLNNTSSIFHYCVYEFDDGEGINRGKYYGVLVYIYFDFPLIGDLIEIPVYGETEVFFDSVYIEG